MPDDLCIEYDRPPPALSGILVDQLSIRQIVGLTDVFGQSAVHQRIGFATKFLAPGPILGLRAEDLLHGAT